ncbi:MAG: class I SAM-dependent RNA methyltransferase, partial [Bradymonadaceae bacterium]
RISKIELPAPEVVAAPSPRRYRNRVTFHWRDKELGFFAEGSRKLIEVVDCPITDELLIDARRFVEGALAGLGEAEVTLELAGNEQVVVSIAPLEGARVPRQLRQGLERLLKETSIFRGFIVEMPAGNLVIGEPTVAAERGLARPPIEDVLLPARQFRQVNDAVNQLLVDHVQDRVREIGKPRVLELYSGAGNFAFALKGLVSGLVGVEGHEVAVETARGLAQQAGLKEFSFEVADLSEGLRGPEVGLDLTLDEFDLLLLDPPRQGAHALCKELVEMKGPEHILYISCDPPCLGRDLQVLGEAGYRVTSLSFFDMFPRTAHIETVAQLTCISD